jgi:hypothetical protein
VGRLTCEAFEKDGQRGYRFAGRGTYEPLLPGKLVPTYVVNPGCRGVPAEEFLAATLAGEAVVAAKW